MHAPNSSIGSDNSSHSFKILVPQLTRCFPYWIWHDTMEGHPTTPPGSVNSMTIKILLPGHAVWHVKDTKD